MKVTIGKTNEISHKVLVPEVTGSKELDVNYKIIDSVGDVYTSGHVDSVSATNVNQAMYRVDLTLSIDVPSSGWLSDMSIIYEVTYEGQITISSESLTLCKLETSPAQEVADSVIILLEGQDSSLSLSDQITNTSISVNDVCGGLVKMMVNTIGGKKVVNVSNLTPATEPYVYTETTSSGTVIKEFYYLSSPMLSMLKELSDYAKMINLNKAFTNTKILLSAMSQGKNLFNGTGKPTQFSMVRSSGIFYGFWLTASKIKLLELMIGVGGANAFDFSGHDVSLTHDPISYLNDLMSNLKEEMSEPLQEFKRALHKQRLTSGSGCGYNLDLSGVGTIGVFGMTPSPVSSIGYGAGSMLGKIGHIKDNY